MFCITHQKLCSCDLLRLFILPDCIGGVSSEPRHLVLELMIETQTETPLETQIRKISEDFSGIKIVIERSEEDLMHTIIDVPQFYALKPAKRYSSVVMRHG